MRGSSLARAARVVVTATGLFAGAVVFADIRILAQSIDPTSQAWPSGSKAFRDIAKRADEARDRNQLDEAVKLYRRALALDPRWAEGWWSLGTLQYDSDRYAEAELAFARVASLVPKQGTARAMLGLCEFELGQSERALRDIEASKTLGVLEDKQLREVVAYHEAVLLQRVGRFEAAKEALASLCRDGVRSGELAETFGMVALRMRDPVPPDPTTEAGQVVRQVGQAACRTGAKDYQAANDEFQAVIARAPHFPLIHYAFGCALIDAQDIAGAVKEFGAEIAEQPKSVLPRLRIAAAEYKVDSSAGLKYAEEVVHLDPALPLGHYLLGLLLLDTGAYDRAVPELEIARKSFPHDGRIDLALATGYAHLGRNQDATRARAEFARKKQAERATAEGAINITQAMDAGSKQ